MRKDVAIAILVMALLVVVLCACAPSDPSGIATLIRTAAAP